MAEFCLDCLNKINNTNDPARKYHLSWSRDFCEECGEYKRVIVRIRCRYILLDRLQELKENIHNIKNPPVE